MQKFWKSKNILYHKAKYSGVPTSCTARAKTFDFFVCYFLSVMLLNGKVGANDFAIKVFDHGKAFNIVG